MALCYRQDMNRALILVQCIIFGCLSACSYHIQGYYNPLRKLGMEKIYVENFRNETYRPGIEHLFTTAMVREIRKSGSFELVGSVSDADVLLSGVITTADADPTSLGSTIINASANKSVEVASEYNATITSNITLTDRAGREIFSQSITAAKIFPGAQDVGDQGSTVPLTNDSEQRLAIQFLANQMMASVYQRMIDTF